MSVKNLLLVSTMMLSALASPVASSTYGPPSGYPTGPPSGHPTGPPSSGGYNCLSDADAQQVATLWTQLIGNYTKQLADAALAPSFTDYSASALSLNANCQQAPGQAPSLGSPVFTNRTQFEMGQGPQAPISSTILNVWHDCTEVTMRYKMTNIGSAKRPVFGIIAIETVKAPAGNTYPYQLNTTYSEFDSAAWVSNLKDAGTCKDPATGKVS